MFAPNAAPNKPFGLPISVFCALGHFRDESWGHVASTLGRPFPGGGYPARLINAQLIAAPGREVIPPLPILKYAFCGSKKMKVSNIFIFRESAAPKSDAQKQFAIWVILGIAQSIPEKAALGLYFFMHFGLFCKNDGFKHRQFLWKSLPREIRWEK